MDTLFGDRIVAVANPGKGGLPRLDIFPFFFHTNKNKSKCGHIILLDIVNKFAGNNTLMDPLYFEHLSCITISSVKYAFQICKISKFVPPFRPLLKIKTQQT